MSKGIELLSGQKEAKIKQIKATRSVRIFSLLGLLLYCLVVGVVFSYSLYTDKQHQNIKLEIENKKQRIVSLKKIESQQVILKNRLSFLKNYFGEPRLDHDKIITFIEEMENDDVSFDKFSFKDDLAINLSGKVKNATVLAQMLDAFERNETKNPFKEVILNNVSRDDEGAYSFTFKLLP